MDDVVLVTDYQYSNYVFIVHAGFKDGDLWLLKNTTTYEIIVRRVGDFYPSTLGIKIALQTGIL